jgi:hypothetical protein
MYTENKTRVLDPGMVSAEIKAGTDGSDYTIKLTIGLTTKYEATTRIIEARAWLKVRDVDEA